MNEKVLNSPLVKEAWDTYLMSGNPATYCFFRDVYEHEYEKMLKKGEL